MVKWDTKLTMISVKYNRILVWSSGCKNIWITKLMLDAVSELLGQTLAKNHNTYVLLLLCMKNDIGDTKKNQKKNHLSI